MTIGGAAQSWGHDRPPHAGSESGVDHEVRLRERRGVEVDNSNRCTESTEHPSSHAPIGTVDARATPHHHAHPCGPAEGATGAHGQGESRFLDESIETVVGNGDCIGSSELRRVDYGLHGTTPAIWATAIATVWVWVSDTAIVCPPRAWRRAAARPVTCTLGAPLGAVVTEISVKATSPRPTPSAFMVASLAAKRAAKRSVAARPLPTAARSSLVKQRSRMDGRRAITAAKRSRSTASMPSPLAVALAIVTPP